MALFSTLTEDFSAGTVDTVKWPTRAGFTQTGGVGELAVPTAAGQERQLKSAFAYDIRGSQLAFKVQTFPTAGNWRVFARIYIASGNFNDYLAIEWQSTTNQFTVWERTTANSIRLQVVETLDTTTQRWARFRESGGTIFFERSADGATWTTVSSGLTTIDLTGAAQQAAFHYTWTAGQATGPTGVTQLDNVNLADAAISAVAASASVPATPPVVSAASIVTTVAATGTADTPNPAFGLSTTVTATVADATGITNAPIVSGSGGNATVVAVAASASGSMRSAGAPISTIQQPVAADATGQVPAPVITPAGKTVVATAAFSVLAMPVPDVDSIGTPTVLRPAALVLDEHDTALVLDDHQTGLVFNDHASGLVLNDHSSGLILNA